MQIKSLKDLKGYTVERGDNVVFEFLGKKYEAEVCCHTLSFYVGFFNELLRDVNNVFKINLIDVAESAYEYTYPYNDDEIEEVFPRTECDDHEALTRCIKEIYKILNKKFDYKKVLNTKSLCIL